MAKWKCLFGWVKKLFISESKEKKPKKLGWSLGRLKFKQHPTITAATNNRTLIIEAKTKQRKHVLAMAVATKAAAEAAVAAAHAAAEVVRLTAASRSCYSYPYNDDQIMAAIKIQSAYRAHLARKALRALKGVVKLQAIVRGQAVRRRVSVNLNKFPCNPRKQAEIQEGRNCSEGESYRSDKTKQLMKQKKLLEEKSECSSQRTWDCSLHSREDIEAIWLRKQEAIAKRERMKPYSCLHREITNRQMMEETLTNKEFGREKETCKVDMFPKSALPCNLFTKEPHCPTQDFAQRNLRIEDSQSLTPRKSFSHVKRCSSVVDDNSMPNSPVFPTYMALTESSKAKARSLSTPRERTRLLDFCYNQCVPQKEGTSFWCSYYDETSQQRSKSEDRFCYN